MAEKTSVFKTVLKTVLFTLLLVVLIASTVLFYALPNNLLANEEVRTFMNWNIPILSTAVVLYGIAMFIKKKWNDRDDEYFDEVESNLYIESLLDSEEDFEENNEIANIDNSEWTYIEEIEPNPHLVRLYEKLDKDKDKKKDKNRDTEKEPVEKTIQELPAVNLEELNTLPQEEEINEVIAPKLEIETISDDQSTLDDSIYYYNEPVFYVPQAEPQPAAEQEQLENYFIQPQDISQYQQTEEQEPIQDIDSITPEISPAEVVSYSEPVSDLQAYPRPYWLDNLDLLTPEQAFKDEDIKYDDGFGFFGSGHYEKPKESEDLSYPQDNKWWDDFVYIPGYDKNYNKSVVPFGFNPDTMPNVYEENIRDEQNPEYIPPFKYIGKTPDGENPYNIDDSYNNDNYFDPTVIPFDDNKDEEIVVNESYQPLSFGQTPLNKWWDDFEYEKPTARPQEIIPELETIGPSIIDTTSDRYDNSKDRIVDNDASLLLAPLSCIPFKYYNDQPNPRRDLTERGNIEPSFIPPFNYLGSPTSNIEDEEDNGEDYFVFLEKKGDELYGFRTNIMDNYFNPENVLMPEGYYDNANEEEDNIEGNDVFNNETLPLDKWWDDFYYIPASPEDYEKYKKNRIVVNDSPIDLSVKSNILPEESQDTDTNDLANAIENTGLEEPDYIFSLPLEEQEDFVAFVPIRDRWVEPFPEEMSDDDSSENVQYALPHNKLDLLTVSPDIIDSLNDVKQDNVIYVGPNGGKVIYLGPDNEDEIKNSLNSALLNYIPSSDSENFLEREKEIVDYTKEPNDEAIDFVPVKDRWVEQFPEYIDEEVDLEPIDFDDYKRRSTAGNNLQNASEVESDSNPVLSVNTGSKLDKDSDKDLKSGLDFTDKGNMVAEEDFEDTYIPFIPASDRWVESFDNAKQDFSGNYINYSISSFDSDARLAQSVNSGTNLDDYDWSKKYNIDDYYKAPNFKNIQYILPNDLSFGNNGVDFVSNQSGQSYRKYPKKWWEDFVEGDGENYCLSDHFDYPNFQEIEDIAVPYIIGKDRSRKSLSSASVNEQYSDNKWWDDFVYVAGNAKPVDRQISETDSDEKAKSPIIESVPDFELIVNLEPVQDDLVFIPVRDRWVEEFPDELDNTVDLEFKKQIDAYLESLSPISKNSIIIPLAVIDDIWDQPTDDYFLYPDFQRIEDIYVSYERGKEVSTNNVLSDYASNNNDNWWKAIQFVDSDISGIKVDLNDVDSSNISESIANIDSVESRTLENTKPVSTFRFFDSEDGGIVFYPDTIPFAFRPDKIQDSYIINDRKNITPDEAIRFMFLGTDEEFKPSQLPLNFLITNVEDLVEDKEYDKSSLEIDSQDNGDVEEISNNSDIPLPLNMPNFTHISEFKFYDENENIESLNDIDSVESGDEYSKDKWWEDFEYSHFNNYALAGSAKVPFEFYKDSISNRYVVNDRVGIIPEESIEFILLSSPKDTMDNAPEVSTFKFFDWSEERVDNSNVEVEITPYISLDNVRVIPFNLYSDALEDSYIVNNRFFINIDSVIPFDYLEKLKKEVIEENLVDNYALPRVGEDTEEEAIELGDEKDISRFKFDDLKDEPVAEEKKPTQEEDINKNFVLSSEYDEILNPNTLYYNLLQNTEAFEVNSSYLENKDTENDSIDDIGELIKWWDDFVFIPGAAPEEPKEEVVEVKTDDIIKEEEETSEEVEVVSNESPAVDEEEKFVSNKTYFVKPLDKDVERWWKGIVQHFKGEEGLNLDSINMDVEPKEAEYFENNLKSILQQDIDFAQSTHSELSIARIESKKMSELMNSRIIDAVTYTLDSPTCKCFIFNGVNKKEALNALKLMKASIDSEMDYKLTSVGGRSNLSSEILLREIM